MKKITIICFILFGILFSIYGVYANDEVESYTEDTKKESVENIDENKLIDEITDGLETILDSDNNELEENISNTMDEYSSNRIVRFFQKLIDAISSFIESILKMASEAAKVGVD